MTDSPAPRHLMEVRALAGWDFSAFVEDVANGRIASLAGCDIIQINDVFSELRADIEGAIATHGLSNLLRRQPLNEALVPPGAPSDHVRGLVLRFMDALGVDSEVVIVDAYFFHSTHCGYADLVTSILERFLPTLSRVVVITSPETRHLRGKAAVEQAIAQMVPRPSLIHRTSLEYHDRFWITASRSKGLVMGTSLNGLGRRYALLDRLDDADVKAIVASLDQAGLLR